MQTVGELHASPVGISFISQVAPPQLASIMMGVWFLGSSIGGYMGGFVGAAYNEMPPPAFFALLGVMAAANGCFTIVVSKPLLRVLRSTSPNPVE
jgi:POT family proton-dependent oligopeptide transporter